MTENEKLKEFFDGYIKNEVEELQEKWIKKAVPPSHEGKFNEWCKSNGFDGVCQSCINKAAEIGGHAGAMARFAVNVSKGKYTWPKKKE